MVLVTAAFGAIVGAAGGALTDVISSKTFTAQVMKTGMVTFGALLLVAGLGELGFVRRLLPEVHLSAAANPPEGRPHRRAVLTGMSVAATFGIICTRPTYLALLLYIALVGSAAYGAVALGAYGIGLAIPVALGGRVLAVPARSARLVDWLTTREEGLRLAQGTLLALLGTTVLAYFWFRYAVPSG
jgi:cytochrome c biogenesis protein CcdA